jgi:hypothetical protein
MKRIATIALLWVGCVGMVFAQEKRPDFSMPLTIVKEGAAPAKSEEKVPAMVRLEVQIAEAPVAAAEGKSAESPDPKSAAEKQKETVVLARAVVATLERFDATIFFGRQEPQITGVNRTSAGTVNSVTKAQVGTQITATPWVANDGTIILKLDIQDSRVTAPEDGVPLATSADGNAVRATGTASMTMKTTLRLRDGEPQVVAGISRDGQKGKEYSIGVRATIIRMDSEKPGETAEKDAK